MLTEEQIAALKAPLPGSAVRTREQAGMVLSYVEGHYCIRRANEIFGFGNWARRCLDIRLLSQEEVSKDGRTGWRISYLAHIEVSVRVGDEWVASTGIGFGEATSYISPGQAHENAAKEAETDAMKRALVLWGDQFGLALYDKQQAHVDGRQPVDGVPSPEAEEGFGDSPACPQCGAAMRLRTGKRGQFWGCSRYPQCKGTRNVEDDGWDEPAMKPVVTSAESLVRALQRRGIEDEAEAWELVGKAAEALWDGMPDVQTLEPKHWQALYNTIMEVLT